jgi:hypothetical protein
MMHHLQQPADKSKKPIATLSTTVKEEPILLTSSAFCTPPSPAISVGCCALKRRSPPRPSSEIYFESRGKCCKKLLRYNGYPNKVSAIAR